MAEYDVFYAVHVLSRRSDVEVMPTTMIATAQVPQDKRYCMGRNASRTYGPFALAAYLVSVGFLYALKRSVHSH